MTNESKCPICGHNSCDDIIIDLKICNRCSHIFKKEPEKLHDAPDLYTEIHFCIDPIKELRNATEKLDDGNMIELIFPTTNFYTLDLQPTDFYKSSVNHYFNQVSSMIMLKRCNLMPLAQQNYWNKEGKMSITKLVCRKGIN